MEQLPTITWNDRPNPLECAAERAKAEAATDALREKCAFLQAALNTAEQRADRAEQRLVEILQTMQVGVGEDRTSPDKPTEAGVAG